MLFFLFFFNTFIRVMYPTQYSFTKLPCETNLFVVLMLAGILTSSLTLLLCFCVYGSLTPRWTLCHLLLSSGATAMQQPCTLHTESICEYKSGLLHFSVYMNLQLFGKSTTKSIFAMLSDDVLLSECGDLNIAGILIISFTTTR